QSARTELIARLRFLTNEATAETFGPQKMPWLIPDEFKEEWAIVTLSMVSAATTNLAFEYPETRTAAGKNILSLVEHMLSPALRNFEQRAWAVEALDSLDSPYGQIGYLGHLNFMLSALAMLGENRHEELFVRVSQALARRAEAAPSHYLETFPNTIFTADNMVVMASLAIFSRLHGDCFSDLLARWKQATLSKVCEQSTGLIPFYVNSTGRGTGSPRGSGLGWNSFYLPFIDEELAAQQYQLTVRHLARRLPLGFAGLNEFLPSEGGQADIDSGPVVFGLSSSGTGFILAGARWHQDDSFALGILKTAELVGSSVTSAKGKRYLIAPLVGDAILLAMRTARPWDTRFIKERP
ncbi:MAG: hypothetical protein J0M12_18195, partial [Deltaproteobacteria bacterium]|nr:hypothetical protein [Deltaproteobacteria bacterium]